MNERPLTIEEFNQLLELAGDHLNIVQEAVDINIQNEYLAMLTPLLQNPTDLESLTKQYVENIHDLFDEAIDEKIKKKMLVVLATVDDVSIYRSIETLSQQEGPLQKWATFALRHSQMQLECNLLDTPSVFISSGLGGRGNKVRYFCVFYYNGCHSLQAFQQKTLQNEAESAIQHAGGEMESVEFKEDYATMFFLLPLKADLSLLFATITDECNQYGNFIHPDVPVTNVKKFTDEEIRKYIPTPIPDDAK